MNIQNEYRFNPWEKELLWNASKVEYSLDLICPFIKLPITKKIISILPKDKKIRINILTRFNRQVFQQKSSDLSMFDLLLNHNFDNLNIYMHSLNTLHAKIFIFDEKKMYLTSSNLSYSGLNTNYEIAVQICNQKEIMQVRSEITKLFRDDNFIFPTDVKNMDMDLRSINGNLIKSGYIYEFKQEAPDTTEGNIEDSILAETEESENDIFDYPLNKESNKTLDEINKFLSERGIKEYNQIEGKFFESSNKPNILVDETNERELKNFQTIWNEKASNDEKIIEDHITDIFSVILSNDKEKLNRLKDVFLHNTWRNSYKREKLNDYSNKINYYLGNCIHDFLIAKSLLEKRLFNEEKIYTYSIKLAYINKNYPYKSILSDINCQFILHMGSLKKDIFKNILLSMFGSFYIGLDYDKFTNLYNKLFNRIDDFVYDDYSTFDYKSILQESIRKSYGIPEYKIIKEDGPDHDKTFTVSVYIGNKSYEGIGKSKKDAEQDAAYNFLKNAKNIHLKEDRKKIVRQKKYEISQERLNALKTLSNQFQINNIRILDVALTHPIIINENPEKRSYRKLAFLGSYLDNILRMTNYLEYLNWKYDKITHQLLRKFMSISPEKCFPEIFDEFKLDAYLVRLHPQKKLSKKEKTETIQALLAAKFIDQGYYSAKELSDKIWLNLYKLVTKGFAVDYVAQVQEIVQKVVHHDEKIIKYDVIRDLLATPNN